MGKARELFDLMIQRCEKLNASPYTRLMDGYCLHGKVDVAMKVFKSMVADGIEH